MIGSNEQPDPKHSKIPEFASREEEAEFWGTHDFTDYLDDSQIVDFNTSDIQSSKIYFHVETDMAKKIRAIAKRKGISGTTLLNSWIREKLREEGL